MLVAWLDTDRSLVEPSHFSVSDDDVLSRLLLSHAVVAAWATAAAAETAPLSITAPSTPAAGPTVADDVVDIEVLAAVISADTAAAAAVVSACSAVVDNVAVINRGCKAFGAVAVDTVTGPMAVAAATEAAVAAVATTTPVVAAVATVATAATFRLDAVDEHALDALCRSADDWDQCEEARDSISLSSRNLSRK